MTHDGRGIATIGGKKVFVAGAMAGEEVRLLRRKTRRNYDEAELLDVLEASPERTEARCEVFGRCGGCSLQHMTPERQRAIKEQTLRDNLVRIGKVEPARWLEPLEGPVWNYRRRARLAVKDVAGKGRVLVGFRERHSPYVTVMSRCEILAEPVDGLIGPLSDLVGSLSIRARLPQIEVAVADNGVALVFRVLDPPTPGDLARMRQFGGQHGLRVGLQRGGPAVVETIYPADDSVPLCYSLPEFDLRIEFSPVGFVQINADVNRRMVHRAVELLDPQPGERVLDLFCGIGNFSLPLARRSGHVLGIEGDASLVDGARSNARLNGIGNAEFVTGDLAAVTGRESWMRGEFDSVLLDPPRSGAEEVLRHSQAIGAKRIVYVSCNPGTLARDAGQLVRDGGYRLESAGIIDMFPHTTHVESMALFIK